MSERSETLVRPAVEKGSKRFATSIIIAVCFHAVLFVVFQWLYPVKKEDLDYTGPIFVTIEEYEPKIVHPQEEAKPVEIKPTAAQTETGEAMQVQKPAVQTPPVIREFKSETPATRPAVRTEESFLPETAKRADEPTLEGVRRIVIPAEKETLPAGLEVPQLKQKTGPVAVPPEFVESENEEKPLYFDLSKLDNALVKESETKPQGKAGSAAGSGVSSEVGSASGSTPVITWDESGADRTLISPITLPKIPEWVKEEGLRLRAVVSFSVTPDGNATSLRVERSSGYADVDSSVLETVRKLKFNPISEDRTVRGRIDYLITPR
ncbi:MAG: TonB family protein [Spirochaetes bacterium]|nr:TonB family protein [Spirochaetota bacterium]